MSSPKEIAFNLAMRELYERTLKETGYAATQFLQLVSEHGAVTGARMLLGTAQPPVGFVAMVVRNRLDLSLEAQILDSREWPSLFSEAELQVAYERLRKQGYTPYWQPASGVGR